MSDPCTDPPYDSHNDDAVMEMAKEAAMARARARSLAYYYAHREACNSRRSAWSQQNRDHVLESQRLRYRRNRDRELDRNHQFREANRDLQAEYTCAYREANREALREKARAYYRSNTEKCKETARRFRAARRVMKIERVLSSMAAVHGD